TAPAAATPTAAPAERAAEHGADEDAGEHRPEPAVVAAGVPGVLRPGVPVRRLLAADRDGLGVDRLPPGQPGRTLGTDRHLTRAAAGRRPRHVLHRRPVLGVEEARRPALR